MFNDNEISYTINGFPLLLYPMTDFVSDPPLRCHWSTRHIFTFVLGSTKRSILMRALPLYCITHVSSHRIPVIVILIISWSFHCTGIFPIPHILGTLFCSTNMRGTRRSTSGLLRVLKILLFRDQGIEFTNHPSSIPWRIIVSLNKDCSFVSHNGKHVGYYVYQLINIIVAVVLFAVNHPLLPFSFRIFILVIFVEGLHVTDGRALELV